MNDLKHDLQTIADRHAQQSGGDFETILRTATSRRRRRFAGVSAAACAVLAVGGIATLAPWQNDGSPAPVASGPTLDPRYQGTMTITPATAAPGAEIALTYPAGYGRGIGFVLVQPADGKQLYTLIAGRGKTKPSWYSAKDAEGRVIQSIGINGPGPDQLVVPDTAADGTYLLCTANAATKACALLTVAR
ncbi:hypothetical protein [Kribbella catacumbae]|uniref:hypothetical protein n=1 Tax=Kribbella catacumbae TaxID=460086 RepID=UPI00037CB78E|nr:hypothetical protein [Kribbella catacumbae]